MFYDLHSTIWMIFLNFFSIGLAGFLVQKLQPNQPTNPSLLTRIQTLDRLRGILALSVLTIHFCLTYIWHTTGEWSGTGITIALGNLGGTSVSFFFLITGYLFFKKIYLNEEMNWKELYLNRCKRIYPLYLFVVLIIVAITLLNTHVDFTNLDDFFAWLKKWLLFRGTHFQNFDSDIIIAGVH